MDSLRTRDSVMLGGRRWQLHRLDRLGVDHLPFVGDAEPHDDMTMVVIKVGELA